ncbi:hypothetical protein DL546_001698 [Coniochaeta pulveracea]|uniref:Uncharacterized protein n=1 Tax=Coniochaeta pulveracea TaxID=177199 RepID=A0A420XX98_9PEZI|nr:hypothetical protein DL546_001698 [Coniochaeta pulveracea]
MIQLRMVYCLLVNCFDLKTPSLDFFCKLDFIGKLDFFCKLDFIGKLDFFCKLDFCKPIRVGGHPAAAMSPTNDTYETVFGAETAPAPLGQEVPSTRADSSYFPSSRRTSFSSNTDSEPVTPGIGAFSRPTLSGRFNTNTAVAVPTSAHSVQAKAVALDALQRTFPAPKEEHTLEEMLARPPQKWSVGHYVKNAREARTPVEDKDEKVKAFARTKAELLAAKAQLDGAR